MLLGNSKGLGSFVPETGKKTKYIFLIMSPNIKIVFSVPQYHTYEDLLVCWS